MFTTTRTILLSFIILFLYSCFAAMSMEFNSARSYARMEDNLEEAEKLYKDVIKQKPNHINSLFYLAGLLAQKKIFNEAKELFEKVIELNPKYPSANDNLCAIYRMLANISSQNGDLLKAKKLFEKAMILNPGNQEISHGYGILLLKLNQHAKGLD